LFLYELLFHLLFSLAQVVLNFAQVSQFLQTDNNTLTNAYFDPTSTIDISPDTSEAGYPSIAPAGQGQYYSSVDSILSSENYSEDNETIVTAEEAYQRHTNLAQTSVTGTPITASGGYSEMDSTFIGQRQDDLLTDRGSPSTRREEKTNAHQNSSGQENTNTSSFDRKKIKTNLLFLGTAVGIGVAGIVGYLITKSKKVLFSGLGIALSITAYQVLKSVLNSRKFLIWKLNQKKEELRTTDSPEEKKLLNAEIERLEQNLRQLELEKMG